MNKTFKILFSILVCAIIISSGVNKSISQVIDIDGNKYKTVIIGTQVWMAENLNVEHYRNGNVIPQIENDREWKKLTTGAWCYYENKTSNGTTYGKLYNWYAVNDSRGLAPEGWHISKDAEWTTLTNFLGGKSIAGGKLKATTLWLSPNTGATNSSGFSAFPGSVRGNLGYWGDIGVDGYFWSAEEVNITPEDGGNNTAWFRFLGYDYSNVNRWYEDKRIGMSVRCVRD
jgi:uncharacterized protein (TIGR02145 family)